MAVLIRLFTESVILNEYNMKNNILTIVLIAILIWLLMKFKDSDSGYLDYSLNTNDSVAKDRLRMLNIKNAHASANVKELLLSASMIKPNNFGFTSFYIAGGELHAVLKQVKEKTTQPLDTLYYFRNDVGTWQDVATTLRELDWNPFNF